MAAIKVSVTDDTDGTPLLRLTAGRVTDLRDALAIALETGQVPKQKKGTVSALHALFDDIAPGRALDTQQARTFYVAADPSEPGAAKISYTINLDQRRARNADSVDPLQDHATWEVADKAAGLALEKWMRDTHPAAHMRGDWFDLPVDQVVEEITRMIGRPPDWQR
ncbi:GIY-YIG nuclease family protein [Marimonas lutisalis]|uniref:GIY-YIG nuclease family protein n=1 Tax=Marimonas lutisalis TaxID=2545756 RepID=UPI0010F68EA3|nr:GIY-YIG nuclease family protein [Marimonas lutisalis]